MLKYQSSCYCFGTSEYDTLPLTHYKHTAFQTELLHHIKVCTLFILLKFVSGLFSRPLPEIINILSQKVKIYSIIKNLK